MELRRLRLVLSAAEGCPASGGVPGPRGYVAGQSGVVSSVLMSPFFMCVLPVTPFRMNCLLLKPSQAKPSQAKVLTGGGDLRESPCLLAIPAFDRIAGLSSRHLNSNKGIC